MEEKLVCLMLVKTAASSVANSIQHIFIILSALSMQSAWPPKLGINEWKSALICNWEITQIRSSAKKSLQLIYLSGFTPECTIRLILNWSESHFLGFHEIYMTE